MRKVYLKESSVEMLASKKPLTFLKFYNELIKFIRGLLNNPIDARPSELLVSNGFNNGKLRHLLVQFGIVKKSEDIDEPINDESGKKESRYHLSYKVPKENFKDKIRKLYHSEKLDEINLHDS